MLLAVGLTATAQDFDRYFEDATLRLDYIFAGNAERQTIAVDELSRIPHWYGKHDRLAEVPVEGNGQIVVRDHRTQKVIYRNSFSTLFQEWLTYDEAKKPSEKSFENVFLVPYPKDSADITIELKNNRREVTVSMTHTVAPHDILIRHIGERLCCRGIQGGGNADLYRGLPYSNGSSLCPRAIQVTATAVQYRSSQVSVCGKRYLRTLERHLEEYGFAFAFRYVLQRPVSDDAPSERSPRLAGRNSL